MKEIKNEEIVEDVIDVDEIEEVEEMKKESKLKVFGSKAKNVVKTHGKKIAVGALFGAGLLLGYAVGHKGGDEDDSDYDEDIIDSDYVELYDVDDNEEETETEEE